MRLKTWAACLSVFMSIGCGPQPGQGYDVWQATLYVDRDAFEADRELVAVGESPHSPLDSKDFMREMEKRVSIGHAKVKVIEGVKGGAKVIVKDTDNAGKVGWMLDRDLKDKAD